MTVKKIQIILKKMPEPLSGKAESAGNSIPAIKIKEVQKEGNSIEGSPGRNIYLLPDDSHWPVPGDIIRDGEKEYEIIEVRICRDLSGKIRAVRCTTLN